MGRKDEKLLQLRTKVKFLQNRNQELIDELEFRTKNSFLLKQNIHDLKADKTKLANEIDLLKKETEKQKTISLKLKFENEKLKNQTSLLAQNKKSQSIAGWTVLKEKDGYYRAKKNIGGKTRSFYVGKQVYGDIKLKLQKKEKEIRARLK